LPAKNSGRLQDETTVVMLLPPDHAANFFLDPEAALLVGQIATIGWSRRIVIDNWGGI